MVCVWREEKSLKTAKNFTEKEEKTLLYANYYYFCGTEKEEKLLFLYLKV